MNLDGLIVIIHAPVVSLSMRSLSLLGPELPTQCNNGAGILASTYAMWQLVLTLFALSAHGTLTHVLHVDY